MNKSVSVAAALLFVAAFPSIAKDWLLINGAFPPVATNIVVTQSPRTNQVVVTNNVGDLVTNQVVSIVFSTNTTVFSNTVGAVFDFKMGNGKARATLTTTNLLPGTNYEFFVGGVLQAAFAGNVRGNANLFFQNFPGKERLYLFPLLFDPRGQAITITNTKTFLTLTAGTATQTPGLRYQESTDLTLLAGSGSAEASYDQDKLNLRNFRINLKGVSAGTYDVWVDGQLRGSIIAKGTSGNIVFRIPFGNNDLPMNFDPRGKLVQVTKGGVVQFSRIFRAPLTLSPL